MMVDDHHSLRSSLLLMCLTLVDDGQWTSVLLVCRILKY